MTFKEEYAKAKAQNVEHIHPPVKVEQVTAQQGFFHELFTSLFGLAFRVLIVWWAVSEFFPEFGLTYWQLVLPVYAVRMLVGNTPRKLRTFKVRRWELAPRRTA